MIKKEALFVLCLALASSASAASSPILAGLRDMAPEIASKDAQTAPIDAVAVDQDEETGPETLDDIGAAKWFRKEFRKGCKPNVAKVSGYWGESARTLPGGNWQGFGTEDRKLDPSINFAVVGLEQKVGRVTGALVALAPDALVMTGVVPTMRSLMFKLDFILNGSTTEKGFEYFTCRTIDNDNLICRVQTQTDGKKGSEKSYRLYQRSK